MNSKTLIAFVLIFMVQFMSSCTFFWRCGEPDVFNVLFESIEVESWNISGNGFTEPSDTISRIEYGITLSIISERELVSSKAGGFGFNMTYALSCEDEYNYPDPISGVEILVNNVKTGKQEESFFNYQENPSDEFNLFESLIERANKGEYEFRLKLTEYDNIPDSAFFTIKITFASGRQLTDNTRTILFSD